MTSRYVKDLKRKYFVSVYSEIYCTSRTDYFAKVLITGGGKRDKRDVDLMDFRMMHQNSPLTYKGYPAYVLRSIATQLKEMLDEGELSVYEYDRDGIRRYHGLRYHNPQYLEHVINVNYLPFLSGAQS